MASPSKASVSPLGNVTRMVVDVIAALHEVVGAYQLTVAAALVVGRPLTGTGPTKRTDVLII
jgi:hypothetical protein